MLSNALRRSMNHAYTFPLFSFCICMSCSMTKACVVQEWCFRKPAWFGDIIFFSSVWARSFSYISLSMTLVHTFVSDIGLCYMGFFMSYLSLGMRNMFACHICFGMFCCRHMSCINLTVISHATGPPCFRSSAVIPSGPGAFLMGRWSTILFIVVLFGGSLLTFSFCPISSVSSYRLVQYSLNYCFSVLFSVGCGFSLCLVIVFNFLTMSHASLAPAISCSILLSFLFYFRWVVSCLLYSCLASFRFWSSSSHVESFAWSFFLYL